jgi:hypothetical protein
MIGPLLRVGLRRRVPRLAAHDAASALLTLGAAAAVAIGAACLTAAAFILLERHLDSAAAWAILGAFWGFGGLFYFAVARRRRV